MLNQTDQYYTRMHAALGDKSLLLEWVRPGRVLDVGCGDGLLLNVLADAGHEVYGIDATEDSSARARATGHDVRQGYANEIATLYGVDFFDTIICSSVLHEVYSYGDPKHAARQMSALTDTLKSIFAALKPGGRLIIRDGVRPQNAEKVRLIFAPNEVATGDYLANKYLSMIPFRGDGYREVDLVQEQPGVWCGNMDSIMEFLYTYTWGEQSFPRETQELYGLFELEDYRDYLADLGFLLVDDFAYLQQGYIEHLVEKAALLDRQGLSMPYPASNMVLIADKPVNVAQFLNRV